MDVSGQEELVSLIFGDNPPEGWREAPEFQIYLQELGNLGPERILTEPERVTEELAGVQAYTQELAFSNYKTFIQTSSCSREIFSSFAETEAQLGDLLNKLPKFTAECAEFQARAQEIGAHRRLTSLTLAKHTSLLEVLELPQLMETTVRNQHYEEALELQAYVCRLVKKTPGVAVLEDIGRAVAQSLRLMLQQLLAQLRAPVQLPQCLKVISYLRRLDVFTESELRLKFLQARETWLDSIVGAVPKDDPGSHLTKTMEVMRVHLFDIVTQYRAIFSEEEVVGGEGGDNRLLFTSWLARKVDQFLACVKEDLARGVPSTESLLGQAMYFGLSFSRVGFDFRPLLAPLFLEAVEREFLASLSSSTCLSALSSHLSSLALARLPSPSPPALHDPSTSPLALMDFTPLAHLANSILGALNTVRACAPLPLAPKVTAALQSLLYSVALHLQDWHSASSLSWGEGEREGFRRLASALALLLLPHLQACLQAVFPTPQLLQVTGLSRETLVAKGLGILDTRQILEPLQLFLPVPQAIIATSDEAKVEYVADKMEELSTALDSTEISDDVDTTEDPQVAAEGEVELGGAAVELAPGDNEAADVLKEATEEVAVVSENLG